MSQRIVKLVVLCVFVGMIGAYVGAPRAYSAPKLPADVDAWLKQVEIGPYQPAKVDWDKVYQAAKREGKVVIYTSSSRTISLKSEFESLYPGVTMEVYELGTTGAIEKVEREQLAGVYNADILHASGYADQLHLLYNKNMLFPFYPPELESVIPRAFREPLVAQRYESRTIFYNSKVYPKCPINSWWDLTKPEWRGKIAMVDPVNDASSLDLITTIVLNADDLARDYQRVFGRPIHLTTPNAGYELLKGIIANKPRIYSRHTDLINVVGDPTNKNPPIGISIPFSSLGYAEDPARGSLKLMATTNITPTVGLLYPSLMNITYKAPHPNAAKLLIKYLFGDQYGGLGMKPFFIVGNWPARTDMLAEPKNEFLPNLSLPLKSMKFWMLDPIGIWKTSAEVQEWWMININ
ncbi:MAG: ABC transporter substrate-binding protein [Bacillota bacterium]